MKRSPGLTQAERVLACVWLRSGGVPMTMREVVDELGDPFASVSVALSALYRQGKLRRVSIRRPGTDGTMYAYSLPKED